MNRLIGLAIFLAAASGYAQVVTTQTTAVLTDSGSATPIGLVADATEPAEGLTPALHVAAPNPQAPRILGFVSPPIAIPYNSAIRQIEAFWNGTPLPLIDRAGKEIVEEPHSYGSMIPFFKPLFSVAALPAGAGTLEIRGYDATHAQLASVAIPGLSIVKPPAPVSLAAVAAIPHPRVYLTTARLAAINARGTSDLARQRYEAALQRFLLAMDDITDVTSPEFEAHIYDAESYVPLLALTWQIRRVDDPVTADRCANAAHTFVMRMVTEYTNGTRTFARDTGYDIRFGLRDLMLAYDWMYERFTPAERAQIVTVATDWVDWYHTTPGYAESWPAENYYAGYLQGIVLTVLATAGDNVDGDRLFALLRTKLEREMPVLNQRLAGGDWAEGWNYGWYSVLELALADTALRDAGEDWSPLFDFLQPLAKSLTYQAAPDFSETRSYGGYSGDYPHRTSPSTLAVLSSTTSDGDYATRLYESMANTTNDFADVESARFYEMIFAKTAQPDVASLPLSYLNSGTGRFYSRSSLEDPQAYFVSTENVPYSFDHYGYANGDVRLYHGTQCLVCPAAYRGEPFDGEGTTAAFSTFLVNGIAQGYLGRNNQNLFHLEHGTWSAIAMRFESSWASSRYDENVVDPANPLDYLIREVVHLRPGTLVVRDLHRRRHASDSLAAHFHIGTAETVQADGPGRYLSGPLRITTFYPAGVTLSFTDDHDLGNNRIGTLMESGFASSTQPMDLVTVFSETLTATSYANGHLMMSDGREVRFANGTITVLSAMRGDVNGDGSVDGADVFYLANFLFAGGPDPIGSADANSDGSVNVPDLFFLVNYLFAGGEAPAAV